MSAATTPMMKQYEEAKRAHPDAILLFRMGDFYELFGDDAKVAAKTLGLALTSRDKGENPFADGRVSTSSDRRLHGQADRGRDEGRGL